MTNLKVKVPFGSSASKMPLEMASETPDKFYAKETDWLKKSHNIRSKLNWFYAKTNLHRDIFYLK